MRCIFPNIFCFEGIFVWLYRSNYQLLLLYLGTDQWFSQTVLSDFQVLSMAMIISLNFSLPKKLNQIWKRHNLCCVFSKVQDQTGLGHPQQLDPLTHCSPAKNKHDDDGWRADSSHLSQRRVSARRLLMWLKHVKTIIHHPPVITINGFNKKPSPVMDGEILTFFVLVEWLFQFVAYSECYAPKCQWKMGETARNGW